MFYSQYVLAKKGPLGKIWLAAHMEKKVPKVQIISTNIAESVESIENPTVPMALRVSGHLLLGVVRIFSRKVTYLLTDCSEAMVKIKDAFRGPGAVDMAPGAATRRFDDITNPEAFDEMDLDAELPSQAIDLSRGLDDELLSGIDIAHAALGDIPAHDGHLELPDAGLDGAGQQEELEGFGRNDNYEVFFEASPAQKRRRTSDPPAAEVERAATAHEEPLPEPEQMREEEPRSAAGWAAGLDEPLLPPEAPVAEEVAPAVFEEREDLPLPSVPDAAGMDEVLFDELEVGSRLPPAAASAQPARRSVAKRKAIVLDAVVQLGKEHMKAQLADPSSIVRADADASHHRPRAAASADPFLAPPHLPFVVPELLAAACAPGDADATTKRPRPTPREPPAAVATPHGRAAAAEAGEPRAAEEPDAALHELDAAATFAEADAGMNLGAEGQAAPSAMEAEAPSMLEPEPAQFEFAAEDAPAHEASAGFMASHELPNVDANAIVASAAVSGTQSTGGHDPSAWSARTHKMYATLSAAFDESAGLGLSYDAMIAKTSSKHRRRVVAGCFQELLFLTTHGLTELTQRRPYGDITIGKTAAFDSVTLTQ